MTRVFHALPALVIFAVPFLVPQLAFGHGVYLFAAVEGNEIRGTLEYEGGMAIANAPVRAYAPDGELIVETVTAEDGSFRFPVSRHCDYRIVGDAGEGHLDSYTVSESELLPAGAATDQSERVSAPVSGLEAQIQAAVTRELAPIRKQLSEHDRATRFRDILGGIGYLFGLAGIVALMKSRKPARA